MRSAPKLWLLSLVVVAALGCSDDDPSGPGDPGSPGNPAGPGELTQADLVGTWNITRLHFQEDAPGDREYDEIADGGLTATMTIDADGDYVLVMTSGEEQETSTGNFEVTDEGVIETSDNEEAQSWEFTLEGNTLTGENTDAEFDFDLEGNEEEAADLSVTLQKVS
jgi:hypothetical protein